MQDGSGLDALPLAGEEVANTTPPIPVSAGVAPTGSTLIISFTGPLDLAADRLPPASAFTVKADDVDVPVQSVGGSEHILILGLPTGAIKQGRTVTVDYRKPTTNPLRDVAGNEAEGFTGFAVDNNSTVDGIPPVPASAEVPEAGSSLTLTFNEDLDIGPGKLPAADAFTVKADGVEVAVQSVAASLSDTLALSLSSTIKQGRTVTVRLHRARRRRQSHPGHRRQRAEGFTDFAVDNNSTVEGIPPIPASAVVKAAGNRLTLTFNEDLDIAAGQVSPRPAPSPSRPTASR